MEASCKDLSFDFFGLAFLAASILLDTDALGAVCLTFSDSPRCFDREVGT